MQSWLSSLSAPDSTVGISLVAAAIGLALWLVILIWLGPKDGRFRVQVNIQKQHYVQAFCHFSIYVYVGLYWSGIGHYAPLIAAQIVFAYFFEMLLSWSRGRVWQLRLGPFPIVFSTSFFLWFREPYFYLQILMIAFAYLAKEYITWTWGGHKRHIFNPSGIVLTVAGLLLLFTGTVGKLDYGYDYSGAFYLQPNLYEVIFLLGLIVMYLFSTTPITLGSFIALWLLNGITDLSPYPVDVYVLLGLTFLLTDPSTSPRSQWGKFYLGLTYGCLIFLTDLALRALDQPPYFDKVFPVPVLNLLAPRFELLGQRVEQLLSRSWLPPVRYAWAVHLALYMGTFMAYLATCKNYRDDFVNPLPPSYRRQEPSLSLRLVEQGALKRIYPEAFAPFAFRQEVAHFEEIRHFRPRTALEHTIFGRELVLAKLPQIGMAQYELALALDPSCAPAHRDIGGLLLEEGKTEAALEHLRKAETLDPEDSDTQCSLGLALGIQGQHDKALPHLRQAVELKPTSYRACFELGVALMAKGQEVDAIVYIRQAAALNPRNRDIRQLLDRLEAEQSQNFSAPQNVRKG